MKKKIILLAICMTTALLALTGCGEKSLSAEKYADISLTGGSGHAVISISCDTALSDDLAVAIYGKDILTDSSADGIADYSVAEDLANSVTYKITSGKTSDFSNGDIISIEATYNVRQADKLKIKMTNTTIEYKVEDLKESQEIDPFEGLVLTYSGIEPTGDVMIDSSGTDTLTQEYIQYNCSNSLVSNDDTITVFASYDSELTTNNAVYFTQKSKDFIVSGLNVYPSDISMLDMKPMEDGGLSMISTYLDQNVVGKEPSYNQQDLLLQSLIDQGLLHDNVDFVRTECFVINSVNTVPVSYMYMYDNDLPKIQDIGDIKESLYNCYVVTYKTTCSYEITAIWNTFSFSSIEVGTKGTYDIYTYAFFYNFATDADQKIITVDAKPAYCIDYFNSPQEIQASWGEKKWFGFYGGAL